MSERKDYYVYILASERNDTLYVGVTSKKRISDIEKVWLKALQKSIT